MGIHFTQVNGWKMCLRSGAGGFACQFLLLSRFWQAKPPAPPRSPRVAKLTYLMKGYPKSYIRTLTLSDLHRHAIHTSMVDPLPHQITAVYGEMLPWQPLRFLLADPGSFAPAISPSSGRTSSTSDSSFLSRS